MTEYDDPFRVYAPEECGPDGYPRAWHRLPEDVLLDWSSSIGESHYPPGARMGVKDLVRAEAGYRCVRCAHPYRGGTHGNGEWSPCDVRCTHGGPLRLTVPVPGGYEIHLDDEPIDTAGAIAMPPGPAVEARWRILTVHHLRSGAEAKRDLRWFNLMPACQRCHLQVQAKVQMDRVWPWEHTPWMRPFAAGFYAWRYLGLELTRTETMGRLDELLALERVA